jgi:hypothetical protein
MSTFDSSILKISHSSFHLHFNSIYKVGTFQGDESKTHFSKQRMPLNVIALSQIKADHMIAFSQTITQKVSSVNIIICLL